MSTTTPRAGKLVLILSCLIALAACGAGSHVCPSASNSLCGCGPSALACPITSMYLYAAGINGQVATFPVSPATGELSVPTYVNGPANSLGAGSFNNQFLYVSNFGTVGAAAVDVWSIDPNSGALTPGTTFTLPALSLAAGLAVDNVNQTVYVADAGKIDALAVNAATGALTPITGSPFPSGSNLYLTLDPQNRFLYASITDPPGAVGAFTVDSTSGALTEVAGSPFPLDPPKMTDTLPGQVVVDSSGKFVFATAAQNSAVAGFSIDSSTGALTPVPGSPFNAGTQPLSLATAYSFLYVANTGDATLSAYKIDSTSGVLTPLTGSPLTIPAGTLAVDPYGPYLYVSGAGGMSAYKIDGVTGALTQIGSAIPYIGATAMTFVP